MWIGGVPNTASLADGRKFLRASSHDLVVVREIAGAERAGIDGIYLGAICVEFVHHGAVITEHADRVAGALVFLHECDVLVNECLVTIHRGFEVAGSGFLVLGFFVSSFVVVPALLLELLADVSELVLVSDVDESSGPRRLIDMMSLFDSSCEILTE